MNTTNALENLAKLVADAKTLAKTQAVAARVAAPKGEKMAHGQHAAAQVGAKIAAAIMQQAPQLGFVPAAGTVKRDKAGNVREMTVTYRVQQTLAQRVEVYKNAAARRKEARAAAKAAKAAKTVPMPSNADAVAALQQLAA
jgi:hypothetical protein